MQRARAQSCVRRSFYLLQIRPALEQQLSHVSAALDDVRQQHAAALEHVEKERDSAKLKVTCYSVCSHA